MNRLKRTLCLLTVLTLCICTAACGKKEEEISLTSQSAQLLSGADSEADTMEETTDEEEEDDDDDAPIDLDQVKIKGQTTTAAKETSAQTATTAGGTSDSKSTAANTPAGGSSKTTAAARNDSASKSTTAAKSGGMSKSATTTKTAATTATEAVTEALTDPAPETDVPAEENVVSGVIDFDTNSYQGEGIALNGATYTITGEGTYILTGSLTGMVEVNSTAKVKLKLGGVNITNPGGPAILCANARKLTITLIEGTQNTLTDGSSGVYNACISSNDTLEIKGAGALNVNATVAHGISSDDDLVVKNGNITVNAVKSGLIANDDITISGGSLRVTGGTNGIKSKATVHISGGTMFLCGGPREDKSAIYAGTSFSLTGGYVYALGCGASQPDPSVSSQCSICVKYSPSLRENTTATINCNGMQFLNETSPYAFNTVFLSTPDIYDGMAFNVFANGAECGEGYTTAGLSTAVAVETPQ